MLVKNLHREQNSGVDLIKIVLEISDMFYLIIENTNFLLKYVRVKQ